MAKRNLPFLPEHIDMLAPEPVVIREGVAAAREAASGASLRTALLFGRFCLIGHKEALVAAGLSDNLPPGQYGLKYNAAKSAWLGRYPVEVGEFSKDDRIAAEFCAFHWNTTVPLLAALNNRTRQLLRVRGLMKKVEEKLAEGEAKLAPSSRDQAEPKLSPHQALSELIRGAGLDVVKGRLAIVDAASFGFWLGEAREDKGLANLIWAYLDGRAPEAVPAPALVDERDKTF
jgi:hypothetical protein